MFLGTTSYPECQHVTETSFETCLWYQNSVSTLLFHLREVKRDSSFGNPLTCDEEDFSFSRLWGSTGLCCYLGTLRLITKLV